MYCVGIYYILILVYHCLPPCSWTSHVSLGSKFSFKLPYCTKGCSNDIREIHLDMFVAHKDPKEEEEPTAQLNASSVFKNINPHVRKM